MSLVSELNNIADELVECHANLKNNLIAKGVECSEDDKMSSLIDKVEDIKTFEYASYYEKILYEDSTSFSSTSNKEILAHEYTFGIDCGAKATVYGWTANTTSFGYIYIKHYRGNTLIKEVSLIIKSNRAALTYSTDDILKGDKIQSYLLWTERGTSYIGDFKISCSLKEV